MLLRKIKMNFKIDIGPNFHADCCTEAGYDEMGNKAGEVVQSTTATIVVDLKPGQTPEEAEAEITQSFLDGKDLPGTIVEVKTETNKERKAREKAEKEAAKKAQQ